MCGVVGVKGQSRILLMFREREREIAYSGTLVKNGRKRFWGYGEWIENRTEKRQGSEERKKRRVIRGRKKTREKLNIEIEKNVSTDVSESAQLRGNAWIKKKTGSKKFVRVSRRRTEKRKVECKWEVLKAGIRRNARQSRISQRCQYALSFQQCNQRRLLYRIYWKSYCSVR